MSTETKIIVRYAETDQMGIAHHSNYAVWFEAARTDYIRQTLGMTYGEMEKMGIIAPLLELSCKYIAPAYYEDELTVRAKMVKASAVKMEFLYEIFKEGNSNPIHIGRTVHGLVANNMKPFNMKKVFPDFYKKLMDSVESEDKG